MDANHLVPILVPLSFFAMVFGILYLRNRERMAMIERGMDPRTNIPTPVNRSYTLTVGLLLIGAGFGLFLAYFINVVFFPQENDPEAIYFSLIAIFGGLGLFQAHRMEKNEEKKGLE